MPPIPITIITGFLGSGKTTLILNLIPQLRARSPSYKLALLKNELGDLAVDSQLANLSSISGTRELLNGCICCNLVGSLGPALEALSSPASKDNSNNARPDRIVIETSGSAFPATLALEVNRLARATEGRYILDGTVSVVDVENWRGYEDTSYTARIQARYTDLIVFNKWEECGERRFDECLDRVGDLGLDFPWVRSRRGWVDADVVFGVDAALARGLTDDDDVDNNDQQHQSEVEVLSVELKTAVAAGQNMHPPAVNASKLLDLLSAAPKEEVYRIKAVLTAASSAVRNSDDVLPSPPPEEGRQVLRYILNWAFGRWTFVPFVLPGGGDEVATKDTVQEHESSSASVLRMTIVLARYEGSKWQKKLEEGGFLEMNEENGPGDLEVRKMA